MKKMIPLIVFMCFSILASAQKYPQGIYMSWDEIKTRTPSQQFDLSVESRTSGDIRTNGGNDYKLTSDDENIKRSFLKKQVWGYSDGEDLYINCFQIKTQKWYTKLLLDGDYMLIKAGLSERSKAMKKQKTKVAATTAMFGGIVGGFVAADAAQLRFLYVIHKETGEVVVLDTDNMKTLLEVNEDLLSRYNEEPQQDDEEVKMRYIEWLNQS